MSQEIDREKLRDLTTPFVPSLVPYNEAARRLTEHYHGRYKPTHTKLLTNIFQHMLADVM